MDENTPEYENSEASPQEGISKKYKIIISFGIILVFIIGYLIYLQITYSSYKNYNDSIARVRYDSLVFSFNNLEKYYLKYEIKSTKSQISEIYYLRDKLFFQIEEARNQRRINILMPERSGMGLVKKSNFNGGCQIINGNMWPIPLGNNDCLFELGITHGKMNIPSTFILHSPELSNASTFLLNGKMYSYEKSFNGINSFCIYLMHSEQLVPYGLLAPISRISHTLAKILANLPSRVIKSDISCYSDKGVLVYTEDRNLLGRTRIPLVLKYDFDNSFLKEVPYSFNF